MAMDWDSWWECERLAVETLAGSGSSPANAVAQLGRAVEQLRAWRPDDGPLSDRVHLSFADPAAGPDRGMPPTAALIQSVYDAVPVEHRPQEPPPISAPPGDGALRRFLAAHAFANWIAYLGEDLRTWVRSIQAAHALATTAGVRHADLLLRHLADPTALARDLTPPP